MWGLGADNFRDVAWLGDCDEGCYLFAEKLGWKVIFLSLNEIGLRVRTIHSYLFFFSCSGGPEIIDWKRMSKRSHFYGRNWCCWKYLIYKKQSPRTEWLVNVSLKCRIYLCIIEYAYENLKLFKRIVENSNALQSFQTPDIWIKKVKCSQQWIFSNKGYLTIKLSVFISF